MKALILAGGFGTRLRPLSCSRPKILFPIINKPLLQWTLERLAKNNIKEAILAVNYTTEFYIKQYRVPKCGVKTKYSRDPLRKPLGTGGPIKKAEKLIGHDTPFLVLNGDIFADVNYTELLKKHREKKTVGTIALHKVEDPCRFGVAELTSEDRIRRFIEKPPHGKATTNLINAGVYAFSPEIFGYIPEGQAVSLEREVFPKLAEESELSGYVFDGLWTDIGKLQDYFEINNALLNSFANLPKHKVGEHVEIKEPTAFDKGVSVGEKSVIGPYVVLGRNVNVKSNVHIQHSIILPETIVSDFSTIDRAIIGEDVMIGKEVKIGEGCVLGDHVIVRDKVMLANGVLVCPRKEVFESVLTPKCIV